MPQAVLIAVGGGCVSALLTLFALSGSPGGTLIAYLAPLPLLLVGLGLGVGVAPLAAAAGVAVVGAFGGLAAAGVYGGLHAFPSWLVTRLALTRRTATGGGEVWFPPGEILCWLAVLAATAVICGALLTTGGIEQSLRSVLDEAFTAAAPGLTEEQRASVVDQIAPLFIGATGVMWIIMMTVNGVGAQGLLVRRRWNRRPSPRWSDLRLPTWYSWVLVAGAVAALIAPGDLRYVARNVVLILATPYFFVGLAVTHTMARRTPAKGFFLATFYVILAFAFPGMSAAVAALGVVEDWIGVRKRLPGPPAQNDR